MSTKIKLLLAEDEPSLAQIILESLETRNFYVKLAKNGEEALKIFESHPIDVLVLDVMMPKKDGFTVAQEIRKTNKTVPILFLTAKSETKDVLEGFEHGGNDYLKKPFSMEELIVRIHALLDRFPSKINKDSYAIGNSVFDYKHQSLIIKKEIISLTHRESELLLHLVQQKNTTIDRSYILKKLWGDDDFFNARSMDVFISKLRKKLKDEPSVEIVNVRGFGYKLIC